MCISDISKSLSNGPGKLMWDLLVTNLEFNLSTISRNIFNKRKLLLIL